MDWGWFSSAGIHISGESSFWMQIIVQASPGSDIPRGVVVLAFGAGSCCIGAQGAYSLYGQCVSIPIYIVVLNFFKFLKAMYIYI